MTSESDFSPVIGGKHGYKLKDLKAQINAWARKPGNGGIKRKKKIIPHTNPQPV